MRADMLKKELQIFTFEDLLFYFPFKHLDKTQIHTIATITAGMDFVQVRGRLISMEVLGEKRGRRLVAHLRDGSGIIELTWFQGINWVQKMLVVGNEYVAFGRLSFFLGKPQLSHPEIETLKESNEAGKNFLEPIYSVTEKLKARGLNGRALGKLMYQLFLVLEEKEITENIPLTILQHHAMCSRWNALKQIHFPKNYQQYESALIRLKFEELFISQLRWGMMRSARHRYSRGILFSKVGAHFNDFFHQHFTVPVDGSTEKSVERNPTGYGKWNSNESFVAGRRRKW